MTTQRVTPRVPSPMQTYSPKLDDSRGVSPVVGTILMVAITVVLASMVAAFLMGFGVPTPTPTATIDAGDANDEIVYSPYKPTKDDGDDILYVEHRGGDELDVESLKVVISEVNGPEKLVDRDLTEEGIYMASADRHTTLIVWEAQGFPKNESLTVGERIVLTEHPGADEDIPTGEYEITLIHTPSNSIIDETTTVIK